MQSFKNIHLAHLPVVSYKSHSNDFQELTCFKITQDGATAKKHKSNKVSIL